MDYHEGTSDAFSARSPIECLPDTRAVRIVTLNLGFLCCEPLAGVKLSLTPALMERSAAAPGMIRELDADVVALQELYSHEDRDSLIGGLSDIYPYVVESPRRRPCLGNGLVMLSRYPISEPQFRPFTGAPFWLWPFWRQGILIADIELPGVGKMRFGNVHLAANLPGHHSEAPASLANRAREIDQLLAVTESDCVLDVLTGDFNASETVAHHNYRRILDSGYVDIFASIHADTKNIGTTWDPANRLNLKGHYRNAPAQRIDHIFIHRGKAVQNADIQVVMTEPIISTPLGHMCLSDHYGMMANVVFEPRRDSEELAGGLASGKPALPSS